MQRSQVPPHGVPDEPTPQQEARLHSSAYNDSGPTMGAGGGQRTSCKTGPDEVTGAEPVVPKEPLTEQPAEE